LAAIETDTSRSGEIAALTNLRDDIAGTGSSGRVYLDFDHTVFLWNSTEAFLNEARPSGLMAPLLKVVSGFVPWKLLGKNGYFVWRDAVRILLVVLLAPWTAGRFRRAAPEIYSQGRNLLLEDAVKGIDPARIVIVSFGVDWIIRALLKGSALERAAIVAPGLLSQPGARSRGKIALLRKAGYEINPDTDIVVTDSAKDDADLLQATRHGHIIRWSAEITTPALANAYFPFFYTAKIKRTPGFLIKQIFLEELPVLLLMFAVLSGPYVLHLLACLTLMFIAYMLVYEIGYAENDRVGERKEAQPKLSGSFYKYRGFRLEPDAWIWAALVSFGAFALMPSGLQQAMLANLHLETLVPAGWSAALLATLWMAFLFVSRLVFGLFNHAPLAWRVFAYLPLHVTKYFGPLLFFPIHPAGVALGCAQIVRTWSMYAIRRAGGNEHVLSSQMVRLAFLTMFSGVVLSQSDLSRDQLILLALAFGFCIVRALPEIRKKMFGKAAGLGPVQ